MSTVRIEDAKKVTTYDPDKNQNGWLIELFKDKKTNQKTEAYLTAALPGAFKGYHLHRIRAARYVALKGKMKITTYERENDEPRSNRGKWIKTERILDAHTPQRLFIPKNVATGLENIGAEDAWLINYPNPPYDPNLKDEQVEYTQEELENGVVK